MAAYSLSALGCITDRPFSCVLPLTPSLPRADAARQKSEALRSLATQLMDEHADYTTKNEQVGGVVQSKKSYSDRLRHTFVNPLVYFYYIIISSYTRTSI